MSLLSDKLLKPISAEQPCGPDLSYDPRLEAIELLLRGKPEVDLGSVKKPAEPPDWGRLKDACIEFLQASRHMRPAVILCCTLIKTDGLTGFRDGLQFLREALENNWGNLYPLLDPDDNNDPQQRLNIIGGLTAPRNAYGQGWLQVVDCLYAVPLFNLKGAAPITLELVLAAAESPAAPAAEGEAPAASKGPDTAAITAQFASIKPELIVALRAVVNEALEAVKGIDGYLDSVLGAGGSINFEDLTGVLQRIESTLAANVAAPSTSEGGAETTGDADGGSSGGGGVGIAISGSIRSRADVVRVLQSVCDYYRQCEPGSPVPLVLQRAQKMATMSFVEVVQELNLATVEQLRPSMGSAVDVPPQA